MLDDLRRDRTYQRARNPESRVTTKPETEVPQTRTPAEEQPTTQPQPADRNRHGMFA
jgi:hypothetical protein